METKKKNLCELFGDVKAPHKSTVMRYVWNEVFVVYMNVTQLTLHFKCTVLHLGAIFEPITTIFTSIHPGLQWDNIS